MASELRILKAKLFYYKNQILTIFGAFLFSSVLLMFFLNDFVGEKSEMHVRVVGLVHLPGLVGAQSYLKVDAVDIIMVKTDRPYEKGACIEIRKTVPIFGRDRFELVGVSKNCD